MLTDPEFIMEIYLFVFLIIFIINIIPAFMPPTWVVLSFLYIHFRLLFLPTLLIGVVAATLGRVVLALAARSGLVRRFLPKKFLANYEDLGTYLKHNHKITIPVVLGFAISPISSNVLFIIAGFSKANLKVIAFAFAIGRFVSYAFWMTTTHKLSNNIIDIFKGNFTNISSLLSILVSLLIIFIMGKINWSKILTEKTKIKH